MSDIPELSVALKYMDELGDREHTRIVCVYGLSDPIPGRFDSRDRLAGLLEFGRFSEHIDAAAALLPRPVIVADDVDLELAGGGTGLGHVRVMLLATPQGDGALVLDGQLPGDADSPAVAGILQVTCNQRQHLRVGGQQILDWLRAWALQAGQSLPAELAFSRNVHQCVFPGGSLLSGIRDGESYWRLVNRVTAPVEPSQQIGINQPRELNYQGVTAVGHGRGVSVIAGFAKPVENVFALIVVLLITSLDVLYRVRGELFETLQDAGKHSSSTAQARALITHLSDRLNDMQLDLGFGVEQYLDSILIPEYITEAFQRSMSQALGLRAGLEDSSRVLDRLGSVIQARRAALDAADQDEVDRRDRAFSTVLAVGTLLALPPALLLAFFALDSGTQRSAVDISAHLGAYALAWLPFIALVIVGYIWRRTIRAKAPQWDRNG
jgi:hypothetical protein